MFNSIKKIFELEAITGILLILATIAALLIANSNYFIIYHDILNFNLPINLNFIGIYKNLTLHDWINDALMAIFFLLIGLELKEELTVGELKSKSTALLPAIAAIGGVIIPALIFYLYNIDDKTNLKAFAVPTATDIAFAYGVICLFGKKISKSLKVFLISLAIFDDLIAIFIIAIFYASDLNLIYLFFASLTIAFLTIINLKKINNIIPYLILGVILWLTILKSGIHPSLAGVILAIFIPQAKNLLKNLIHKIGPTVNFLILPIFAFANSGVRIQNFSFEIFKDPLVLGILCGLFFGKQIGVMLFSFISIKLKITNLPGNKTNWLDFYGVTILTGIGFTMSFFIGSLSFIHNEEKFNAIKIGVLSGSFLSAVFGMLVIYFSLHSKENKFNS